MLQKITLFNILLFTIKAMSKYVKLKWNHNPQLSGFTAKFGHFDVIPMVHKSRVDQQGKLVLIGLF